MTLSSAVANYGLSAIATPTGTNVANDVKIGVAPASVGFPTADVAYSFKVTSTGATDAITWDAYTSTAATASGFPSIADGDGKDFEGIDIPNLLTLYSILYVAPSTNTGTVVFASGSKLPSGTLRVGGGNMNKSDAAGVVMTASESTNTATFSASGDEFIITVIGKSS